MTNNSTVYAPPTVSSAATNASGTTVSITFNKAMASPAGDQSQFTVHVDAGTDTVTAAALHAGDNTTIDLTLTTPILHGQTVTVDYTAGTVTSADTGILASFSGQSVTNNSTSVVEDLSPNGAGDETNIDTVSPSEAHWQAVSEYPSPDDDSSYVEATPLICPKGWKRDLYAVADNSVGSGTINSVTVYARMKDMLGAGSWGEISIKTEGTAYNTSAYNIPHQQLDNFFQHLDNQSRKT